MCSIGEEIEAMDFRCVLADAMSFVKTPLVLRQYSFFSCILLGRLYCTESAM